MKRLALAGLAAAAAMAAFPGGAGAALIPVTTGSDEYETGPGCSLREAVQSANTDMAFGGCPAGESPGADSIQLPPGGTHTLTTAGSGEDANATGDLDASVSAGPLSLIAAGAGPLPVIAAGSPDRLLDVTGNGALTISGLRLTGGVMETGNGGAIRWTGPSTGNLTVTGSLLDSNSAVFGGAIDADTTGTHTIQDSTVRESFSVDLGAIHSSGVLRVQRTSVVDNIGGGVVAQKSGADSLLLEESTVAGNRFSADTSAGGVAADGEATVVNSTITGNIGGFIGGIDIGGPSTISFSTIAENGAPPAAGFAAGGIGSESGTTVAMNGVVLSGNQLGLQGSNCGPGVAVTEGPDPNLESADTCGLSTAGGSLVNAAADLAPLASNGGPTPTRGLYPGSPALDAGLAACSPAADQRGVARPGASAACDLGAFEGTVPRPPPPPPATTQVPASVPAPTPPVAKKCGKKQKRAKGGKCVKKKAKKKGKGRLFAAEAVERVVIGRSVRGRKIVATRVGDPDGERVALAVGVIHGDERAGLAVLDQIATAELDGVQLWVIPSLNPDGQRSRQRRNARGVDLNRNFPFRWRGGTPPSSGYYPGRAPASEPETKAAMAFIERVEPSITVWYHQPWGAVLACRGTPKAAVRYASLTGMRTSCRGKGLRGTAISWQRDVLPGSQAFVVELGARGVSQEVGRRHAGALATIARDGS